jgi:hypothetical protein
MSEQFDPTRHRIFAVDVTRSYRTYVVADSAEAADRLAMRHEDGDLDWYDASRDAEVSEVTAPLTESDDQTLPWGPYRWGRRELTVNQALELVTSPRPAPPPPPATDQFRPMRDWDWVRLAAGDSRGRASFAPYAVQVAGGRAVATDGYRLHIADAACPPGMWDADTMEPVTGPYLDWRRVVQSGRPCLKLVDLTGVWQELRRVRGAGHHRAVSLPTPDGHTMVDPDQLAEALLGGAAASRVLLAVSGSLRPIRLDFPELRRTAVIMPLRRGEVGLDLGAFLRPLSEEAAS